MAVTSSSPVLAFEMPTLDPRLAGLTNSGNPSACGDGGGLRVASVPPFMREQHAVGRDGQARGPAKAIFMNALSMPTAEARTPAPT